MTSRFLDHLAAETTAIKDAGLYKTERVLTSPQDALIRLEDGTEVINLCANNYLGLANAPDLVRAARTAAEEHGYGMASVRFICGTQDVHKQLEAEISTFLSLDSTILYSSCWDANGGLFETVLGDEDAVISDALNHASIIDGIRLCKAARYRYANNDMEDLERQLRAAASARFRLIATDGVFSMDGTIANLPAICELAETYDAMVMVDDSHAVGFIGATGAGTPEYWNVQNRVHIVTGTFGKALGGASGGYTSGPTELVEMLRQRSRPYLFSNSLAPTIAATTLVALDLLKRSGNLRERLASNASRFRAGMEAAGFTLAGADHPIIPIMLGDASIAAEMADRLLDKGVYVIGFSYPVVPRGEARIRTQMSAAHSDATLDAAMDSFVEVGRDMGLIR